MSNIDKILNEHNSDNKLENEFISFFRQERNNIKTHFNAISKYACPCKRKHMTNEDYANYKNEHTSGVWSSLHKLSFKYLDKPTENIKKLIHCLLTQEIARIPCSECRKHYTENLKKNDMNQVCDTRLRLVLWLVDLHNDVNKRLKKEILSNEKVFDMYNHNYNKDLLKWIQFC